jgi:rhamnosyltransferase
MDQWGNARRRSAAVSFSLWAFKGFRAVMTIVPSSSPFIPMAVVVAYHPDFAILERLLDTCLEQVAAVVVVDNGETSELADWLTSRNDNQVFLIALGQNRGIASAQNAGIEWATSKGASHVILFDHDSEPPAGLVAKLSKALHDLEAKGERVAAVGPRYTDKRRADELQSPFIQFNWRMIRQQPLAGVPYVPADFLIASGSLIPLKALRDIGGMEDKLFIDYVDLEWGFRAHRKGWAIYGVWDAVMEHTIGDNHVSVLGREITIHSPLRHYYFMRNAVWMVRQDWLFWRWRSVIIHNALRRFVAYSLFMQEPGKHFRFMCLGLWHGLCGRMGKY